jgi:hypothetical protein
MILIPPGKIGPKELWQVLWGRGGESNSAHTPDAYESAGVGGKLGTVFQRRHCYLRPKTCSRLPGRRTASAMPPDHGMAAMLTAADSFHAAVNSVRVFAARLAGRLAGPAFECVRKRTNIPIAE